MDEWMGTNGWKPMAVVRWHTVPELHHTFMGGGGQHGFVPGQHDSLDRQLSRLAVHDLRVLAHHPDELVRLDCHQSDQAIG